MELIYYELYKVLNCICTQFDDIYSVHSKVFPNMNLPNPIIKVSQATEDKPFDIHEETVDAEGEGETENDGATTILSASV